jgi:hypothetical protein
VWSDKWIFLRVRRKCGVKGGPGSGKEGSGFRWANGRGGGGGGSGHPRADLKENQTMLWNRTGHLCTSVAEP